MIIIKTRDSDDDNNDNDDDNKFASTGRNTSLVGARWVLGSSCVESFFQTLGL